MKRKIGRLFFATVVAAVVVAVNGAAFAQQVSGAIFTTDHNSSFVNGNVYDSMDHVYLSGGPRPNAPCTAAGLPEGDYYFQVTDPSGSILLSSDDITHRKVTVSGGLITQYFIIDNLVAHSTGIGKCNDGTNHIDNITVGLAPFTHNPGGEYKVWMTKVADYIKFGGFIPSKSKTDNFKVVCPGDSDPNCAPEFG